MATIKNLPDRAGATRDTLQKLVRMHRARMNSTEEPAGYQFGGKEVMRKVVATGALPDSTTKATAHGIAAMDAIVALRGVAYDLDGMGEVQGAKPLGDAAFCDVDVDATNITLTTVADETAYDQSHVEIEYTLA